MTTDERLKLITRNLEEVLTEVELRHLIDSGTQLKHYIGYEISGKVHIGQGLFTMMKIRDLQQAGVKTTILLADWHTWLNKKLDGKLETASRLGREYLEQAFRAGAICVGADPDKIEFVLGSEVYQKLGLDYWATVIRISKATTISRMIRSTTAMGRKESEVTDSAMLIYPAMQSADIFMLGVNIAHAGTDQRNVHVVAREAADEVGFQKPIAIHAHLLQGLVTPTLMEDPETGKKTMDLEAAKMSKSKPDSGIYLTDSPEEIKRKINAAYCPEGEVEFNPILDWCQFLVFYDGASSLLVQRDEKFGGNVTYNSYSDLERDYAEKKLHPMDLKGAVAEWLTQKLEPARKYFEDPKRQSALKEIEQLAQK